MGVVLQHDFTSGAPTNIEDLVPAVGTWLRRGATAAYSTSPGGAYTGWYVTNGGFDSPWYSADMPDAEEMYNQFLCTTLGFETFILLVGLNAVGAQKNGYGLKLVGTDASIIKYTADVESVLGTVSSGATAGHTYRLNMAGGTLTATRDGASILVVADSTYTSGVMGFEFQASGSTALFDNALFDATYPPPAAPTDLTATCSTGIGESTLLDAPSARFTADVYSGLAPLTVQFTDRSTNTPTSWLWEDETGTLSTDQNPLLVFALGRHTVRLTATNASGSSAYRMTITATDDIVVTPPDDGVVTKSGSVQGNLGMIGYYTVDTGNHQVKIHSTAGALLKTSGSGVPGDGPGEFFMPTSVSVINGRQRLDRVTISED